MNAKITYRDYEEVIRLAAIRYAEARRMAELRPSRGPGFLMAVFVAMDLAGAALAVLAVVS